MNGAGKKIVLVASHSESCEWRQSSWYQMLLATTPARYARHLGIEIKPTLVAADGQAVHVPHGLRIVESLLLQRLPAEDVAVCYTDQLPLFVGENTRAVGIHAHNPLGITFATDVYSHMWGSHLEPVNAADFRRLITHPLLRRHKPHLKVIVGGPGAWQLEKKNLLDEWGIDCLVDGEAEDVVLPLFEAALRGEALPRKVEGHSPSMDHIPPIRHRTAFGVVEITRGCGRGCQFCSIALRRGKSYPLQQILANVRTQVAEGAETILLTTEDLFLYEQGPKFDTNVGALKKLFHAVISEPGVRHLMLTHGTISPVVRNPEVVSELSPYAVDYSIETHPDSTHPQKRYADFFIGLETGSPRLFEGYMKGKAYPFRPQQWPDVVLKGMEILNQHNWFPFCTMIIGLPGETREDTRQTLDMVHALFSMPMKGTIIPTLFVSLDDTRLANKASAKLVELTDLQWEFFFTCWRHNLDFFRRSAKDQWKFRLGAPLYYYLYGRKHLGPEAKYPLFRLGHVPEWLMKNKLYLDFSGKKRPRLQVPKEVRIPEERARPAIPQLRPEAREDVDLAA